VFDRPDSKVNLLTEGVMRRLDELIGEVEQGAQRGTVRALVIRSGKPGTFIAGADVRAIENVTDPSEGEAAARQGQELFRRIEQLPIPTVAAIDGICLGGGTELILACGHRIASDSRATKIGLPEVRLGIIPGFGGTTRLPRLIGLKEALGMILTGRNLDSRRALRVGLVDEVVPAPVLYERAEALAREVAERGRGPRRKRKLTDRLLDHTLPGQRIVLAQARKQVLKETKGHYPAPLKALDVIRRSIGAPLDRAFALEARALGELIVTDVSKNLIHVFH